MPLLFDSHLDLAWNALSWKRDLMLPLAEMNRLDAVQEPHPARGRATVSLPELRRGQVAVCLATLMGRVPYGATTNVQGAIVREAGGQFLHVELAAPLRRALLDDATLRASFLATLADALEGA